MAKEKILTPYDISELLGGNVSPQTLAVWLGGYRFTRFETGKTKIGNLRHCYKATQEFFNALYSYLVDRTKTKTARILQENLKKEGVEVEYKGIWKE